MHFLLGFFIVGIHIPGMHIVGIQVLIEGNTQAESIQLWVD